MIRLEKGLFDRILTYLRSEYPNEGCGILAGSVDAVLAGDAGAARVQFPPAYRASLIQATGLAVWTGFNCRDRNRVAMEGFDKPC